MEKGHVGKDSLLHSRDWVAVAVAVAVAIWVLGNLKNELGLEKNHFH